jgi:nucleolar GTP-binding protein
MDTMPEIMDGKNVADFIDPDIAEKLEALEREEERLQAEGFYDEEEDMVSPDSKQLIIRHITPNTISISVRLSRRARSRRSSIITRTQDHITEYQKVKEEPVSLTTYSRPANSH